jgi:hypothetical protein
VRTPQTTPYTGGSRYTSGLSPASSAAFSYGRADSPPQDLGELAAYTRREREKFEALNAAHQQRMQQLMGPELPLSPDVAPNANRHKLEALQRHFDESRQSAVSRRWQQPPSHAR